MAKERMSIYEMKAANEAIGQHWFDTDTMRFFNTRIESQPDKNDQFITSESYDGERKNRRYTLRGFDRATGEVKTLGEFNSHRTMQDAREFRKDYNREVLE